MDDFSFQLEHVKGAARRLLWLQDRVEVSPSRGCFHYAYWRDKTSDVADARFQEAGAALGLLSHPALHDASLPSRETLYGAFLEAARFLGRSQHADGSFDEWWKGERGFAATEFPVVAFALTLWLMGDEVKAADRAEILVTLRRGADWLLAHDDQVKTNHQAAACAALALMHALTGDARYKAGAEAKRADVLKGQTSEGWFNEVAGMDLGYCGVLLDYMMLARMALPDEETLPAMRRLYSFMHPFISPVSTIPAEAGICLNPYVSRLGTALLASHSPEAADIARRLASRDAGFDGIAPYLADDLRLCRWAYLPAATSLLRLRQTREPASGATEASSASYAPKAGVYARREKGVHVVVSAAGAGAVEAFFEGPDGRWSKFADRGYRVSPSSDGPALFTGGYRLDRPTREIPGGLSVDVPFAPAVFFYPPYFARVVLRVGCAFPGGSYWLRRGIDLYRQWKGTALNQSAAPIASGDAGLTMKRAVRVIDGVLEIDDELVSTRPDLDLTMIAPESLCDADGIECVLTRQDATRGATSSRRITRRAGIRGSAGLRTSGEPARAP